MVQDVLTRYVEEEMRFLEGVDRGIAAAERGDFIEEEEMDARTGFESAALYRGVSGA
jgi:predicted transcriptional regulator